MPTTIAAPTKAPAVEAEFLPLVSADYAERRCRTIGHERHSHLRRSRSPFYRARRLQRCFHARIREMGIGLPPVRDRPGICRSLRGQRRLEPDESVGEILRGCDGLQ